MQIDDRLISLCKKNDRRAQFELYKHSFNALMNICIRYEKNKEDAAELVNKGFLKILNNIGKYRKEIPFEAWIKRIMINTAIDDFRKNKKTKELFFSVEAESMDYQATPDYNLVEEQINTEELERMLNSLPKDQQVVFNLYEIDDYTHKEIGDKLNISERTSKRHLSAARIALQKMLTEATEVLEKTA